MKITMYELLGMVKDGKAPKKFIYDNQLFILDEEDNVYRSHLGNRFGAMYQLDIILNDEVEIIEEEKKTPEKLDIVKEKNCKNNWKWQVKGEIYYYNMSIPQKIIADKLNEIINYLKSKGDE